MAVIECKNLCKAFSQGDSRVVALDNVSILFEKGEFVCLAGPSGSGKTTLLNAIGALDKPDSGEVRVGAQLLNTLSKSELADLRLLKLGFVFQAYNLIPVLTARENVEFVMQVQGVGKNERHQRATLALKDVGLSGMEDRLPSHLSGGQQQRVAVARAIVSNPEVVLADEPTANLDSKAADQLLELFAILNERHKVTFVIATHDPRVMNHAKRLVSMQDGKIIGDDFVNR